MTKSNQSLASGHRAFREFIAKPPTSPKPDCTGSTRVFEMEEPTEEEVMRAIRVAGWSQTQINLMTYTSWKDGIDIEKPTVELMAFAQLMRRAR